MLRDVLLDPVEAVAVRAADLHQAEVISVVVDEPARDVEEAGDLVDLE
jgi:hypothetical protein